jgi:hypothetical protein
MFQFFSNHSSADHSEPAVSRINDNESAEEVAMSDERPATYDEMLPWLLLGAVAGF